MSDHDPAPRRPMTGTERLLSGAFLFVFAGLLFAEVLRDEGPARMGMVFVALSWWPLIVLHELGHLLTARMVGYGVCEFVVGHGRPLLSGHFGETHWTLRAIPLGGHVVPFSRTGRPARLAMACIYLGGPGAELLLIGLLAAILGPAVLFSHSTDLTVIALQGLALGAAIGAVTNLIPLPMGDAVTDGLGIVTSPALTDETFEISCAAPYQASAQRLMDWGRVDSALTTLQEALEQHPENLPLKIQHAVCLAANGDKSQALAQLESIKALPELSVTMEARTLDAAAQIVLECDDHTLGTQALGAARAATQLSMEPQHGLTFGRVLLKLGQHQQAADALMRAYKRTASPRIEGHCIAFLAIAHHALGEQALANRFLDDLRSYGAGTRILQATSHISRI